MIQLTSNYRGRPTNEKIIPPGVYAENDSRLFGLADYLVQNGHATVVQGSPRFAVELAPLEEITNRTGKIGPDGRPMAAAAPAGITTAPGGPVSVIDDGGDEWLDDDFEDDDTDDDDFEDDAGIEDDFPASMEAIAPEPATDDDSTATQLTAADEDAFSDEPAEEPAPPAKPKRKRAQG